MRDYNLGFISNKEIYGHVESTMMQYRRSIDLNSFNKNLIDPIKLTFDSKIYGQDLRQTIESECLRQVDKTNNNCIGYFHQNIFKYAGGGWEVPENGAKGGFDIVNEERHIFVEMKNKHNTMNSASTSSTYLKMQAKLLEDDSATCMLVECISKRSQDVAWKASVKTNGFTRTYCHDHIRRVSMDKFYEIVYGDKYAFYKLCKALPDILDDVIEGNESARLRNSVYDELDKTDFYKSLYLLAFQTYEGFDNF